MQVVKHSTYDELSRNVAQTIAKQITNKPDSVLCLATGSTPIGMYQELIRLHQEENLDFSNVTTFNLDEYFGLSADHPQSYRYFMKKQLFNHINISKENIHHICVPSNKLEDVDQYCQSYDEKIHELGGFDLLIDGIGMNGHIGFNEPAHELEPHTHIATLAQSTIDANSRFFSSKDEVPRYALTMGVASMFMAKRMIFMASGTHKAKIVHKILHSNITTQNPASLLKMHHNMEMHLDSDAAQLI